MVNTLAPVSHASETRPGRLAWVDEARGAGIFLVVFGHVWRGVESAGLIADTALFNALDRFVYAFHMPLFFFLSGLLSYDIFMRRPLGSTLVYRAERLLWPLVLWTWVYFTIKGLMGDAVNNPSSWSDFPLSPLPPREQFWFLWALFVIQVSFLLLGSLLLRARSASAWVWPASLAATMVLYFVRPSGDAALWFGSAVAFAPYFVLGALVAYGPAWTRGRISPWLSILGFSLSAGAMSLFHLPPLGVLLLRASAVLCFVAAIRAVSPHLPALIGRALGLLGAASMAIYVAHVIFTAGQRIVLLELGVQDLQIHVVTGVFAGLFGPISLFLLARYFDWERRLGF